MTKEREGEILLIIHSFFESWFPIVSAFAIALVGAIFSYALTILFSAIALSGILIWKKQLSELLKKDATKDLLLASFFITLMFLLIFIGLRYTSSGNAAVIIFMQLFFSYLYFNLFGKEALFAKQLLGAAMMGIGAIVLLIPENMSLNRGDVIILLASAIAPIANWFQKKARRKISSVTLLTFRNIVAFPIILTMAFWLEPLPDSEELQNALVFVAINGVFIMGISKIMWIEAIHRISITKASAMIAFIPLFTMLFAYFSLDEVPSLLDGIGAGLIMLGSYYITRIAQPVIASKTYQ